MIDEDLTNLRRFIAALAPDTPVDITGGFICEARELLEVIDDALVRRAVRRAEASPNPTP